MNLSTRNAEPGALYCEYICQKAGGCQASNTLDSGIHFCRIQAVKLLPPCGHASWWQGHQGSKDHLGINLFADFRLTKQMLTNSVAQPV